MPLNNGDVFRTTLYGTMSEKQVWNLVFYHKYGGPTVDDHDYILDQVGDWATDLMQPLLTHLSSQVVWTGYRVFNITQNEPIGDRTLNTPIQGSVPGDYLPDSNAALIVADTGHKRCKAKKFIPGLAEARVDGNKIGTSLFNALVVAAVKWLASMPIGDYLAVPGVWRRILGTFVQLVSGVVQNLVASQRRRKPGRGI